MKRILTSFLVFIFLIIFSNNTFAQTVSQTPSPTPQITIVQYYLPYPGILPDNPLYFLKAIRDNLVGFFISDPLKKSQYDLLMADKRLVSAKALVDKGNDELAITTLSKAGNYFDQAIQLASSAKQQGEDVNSLLNNLYLASQKHQEVINQMEQKTKGNARYNLELLQVRAKNFQDTVQVIKSQ